MSMLSSILGVAKAAAEQFVPGVAKYEAAADAVVAFVNDIKPTLSSEDQAALSADLPALLETMNRNVDQAEGDLRG